MHTWFRWLLRGLLLAFVLLPIALAAMLYLCIDEKPLVLRAAMIAPANIERAKRLLDRNDPRRMRAGVLRSVAIGAEDLDLALNYFASRRSAGINVVLREGGAAVRASIPLPNIGRYINVDASLVETSTLPRFDQLTIGQLPVPAFIANRLLREALGMLQERSDLRAAGDVIKTVRMRGGVLHVVYAWNDALPDQLKAALIPPAEQDRLKVYQERLASLDGTAAQGSRLDQLLQALFQLAAQRAGGGADPALENRAAIIVTAFHVNGKGLEAIIPAAAGWPRPAARKITLGERHDFAQHFSISAAITATAGSPLADAVGLYKEVDDSRGGSGFSFNDIAADRAGTRFGALATASPAGARMIQQRALAGFRDSDLLPNVSDLPEFMTEAEFKRRFGGIGAPVYQKMMADIERRIAALPLYR